MKEFFALLLGNKLVLAWLGPLLKVLVHKLAIT